MPERCVMPCSEQDETHKLESEHGLISALIAQALNDLSKRHYRAKALAWIFHDEGITDFRYTFDQCCEYLGINACIIHERIKYHGLDKFIRYRTRKTKACRDAKLRRDTGFVWEDLKQGEK